MQRPPATREIFYSSDEVMFRIFAARHRRTWALPAELAAEDLDIEPEVLDDHGAMSPSTARLLKDLNRTIAREASGHQRNG